MPPSSTEQVKESPDERELRDQPRELTNEVTDFFDEAEKSIFAHPTQSVIGARWSAACSEEGEEEQCHDRSSSSRFSKLFGKRIP